MNIPDPDQPTPSTRPDLTNVIFLKNEVTSEFIEVGAYTYADSEGNPAPFEQRCVKYLYGPQKLRIGKFFDDRPGRHDSHAGWQSPHSGPVHIPVHNVRRRLG